MKRRDQRRDIGMAALAAVGSLWSLGGAVAAADPQSLCDVIVEAPPRNPVRIEPDAGVFPAEAAERSAVLRLAIRNGSRERLSAIELSWTVHDRAHRTLDRQSVGHALTKALKPGVRRSVSIPVPTLSPDSDHLVLRIARVELAKESAWVFEPGEWNRDEVAKLKQAAEDGVPNAQYRLGLAYQEGSGVPQDNIYAYLWLHLAALADHEVARAKRDRLEAVMSAEQLEEAQSLARNWVRLYFHRTMREASGR